MKKKKIIFINNKFNENFQINKNIFHEKIFNFENEKLPEIIDLFTSENTIKEQKTLKINDIQAQGKN